MAHGSAPPLAVDWNCPLATTGAEQLGALARSEPAFAAQIPRLQRVFTELLGPYASAVSLERPPGPSDVVDDGSPYEFSLALGGASPELRILVEPPGETPTVAARWRAAREVLSSFASKHGADPSRLERVVDLFEPTDPQAVFGLWLAMSFWPGKEPELKAYVNLQAQGAERAPQLLEEALDRLGLAGGYASFMARAMSRGTPQDELKYLALDLAGHGRARVKAYARHHGATVHDLERVIGHVGGVRDGDVRALCEQILGGAGPFDARPIVTCWAFTGGSAPTTATLYAPIASYTPDDRAARKRIVDYLGHVGIDAAPYERAVAATARRPLEAGSGLHSYVSFKRDAGAPKVTVYFAPELYEVFPPGSRALPAPARVRSSPEELVQFYEGPGNIASHPLFRRLQREPVRLDRVWTVLANGREGIGKSFPRWLASIVARIDDDSIRSILAKQLNDELGDGDPTRAHGLLYKKMLDDFGEHRPVGDEAALCAPAKALAAGLADLYTVRPPYEGLGATLLMEVFGKQHDQVIGGLLRRQKRLDPTSLTWLVLHETLEEEHADESMALARMAPADGPARAAMSLGAEDLAALAWRYLDELYGVVFEAQQ